MKRDFDKWLDSFRDSISTYDFYVNFDKVYRNVDDIKIELNIMNSLIGSDNIEADFDNLYRQYPDILKCIPTLLAVRSSQIYAIDKDGEFSYNFAQSNQTADQYKQFMAKTGLFELLSKHLVSNLVDYATGVEVGLDSNGRKNRGGHLMEGLVESYIQGAGFIKGKTYFKEMNRSEIERKWNVDLSTISNHGKTEKRFDYVIKTPAMIYAIETNFYSSGGSKLNETARSYKTIALEADAVKDRFTFMWFTDGKGWNSAQHNLEETFDAMEHIYNINDLQNNVITRVVK